MNKETVNQSLMTEYMLLKSLRYRNPTGEDVDEFDKMNHRLKVLREIFKTGDDNV